MFAAVEAIEPVVGAHHRPRLRGLNRNFKAFKINLVQSSIIDDGVHKHTATLLVVHCKVLKASPYALGLYAPNQASGDMTV